MKTALPALLAREIESLFYSPLAYIVLTIFLMLMGVSFQNSLHVSGGVVEDTVAIFLAEGAIFWLCLVLIPPLVTMRLVSEERRSGQLEVMLTAPVRESEVILAKFLGAMVFQSFLWAPTLIHVLILRNYGALPSLGQLASLYVGIFSVTALFSALGLLLSTLTTNQIVAAVGAITLNMLLIALPAFAAELRMQSLDLAARNVSIVEHFSSGFSRGILDTSALVFYGAGTAALLVVATRSLEARKWR